MASYLEIYLAAVDTVGVTQRMLDYELEAEDCDTRYCNALANLLNTEISFMYDAQREAEHENKG